MRRYLDADMEEMDINAQAYALKFTISAITEDSTIYIVERNKMVCDPKVGLSTRSGMVTCEGGRGRVDIGEMDDAVEHLESCSTSGAINNGVCDEAYNNEDNCWDGGDCCGTSCYIRNGDFWEFDDDGNNVPAHSCNLIDDAATCLDPAFAGDAFEHTFDYT
jgi:hypothetical protein